MSEKGPEYSREAYDAAEAEAGQTEEKRAGLEEMAWDEALELNEKYDELYSRKEQVDQDVATFRREKLGMKEEEKKEPVLEEQAGIYAEMFGVDAREILEAAQSLQTEMSEDERKEFTMLIYGPKGTTVGSAWAMVEKENPTRQKHKLVYSGDKISEIKTEGETDKAFIAFARYSQEPDEDSLGEKAKSASDWEETGQKFMSPKLRMIAGEMYRRAEGRQLDEKYKTVFPGSRMWSGYVPMFDSYAGTVSSGAMTPEYRSPQMGVRRVVSKEF